MMSDRPSRPNLSKPSSGNLPAQDLGPNERYTLDMLATEMFLDQDLPMASRESCNILHLHGYVQRKTIARHGKAWGITEAGQAYLIRQYKTLGARV